MSTSPEVILVTVDIKANNERLVELTKQLNENRAAQKALADANKAGTLSADELAAGQVRLRQQAADLTGEVRTLTKANADQDKANKSSAGSINQLRAELARGTTAYNALSEAERDNTEAGQKLQAANKALSDRLKELEKAVGDTRRNVGNYKDSLKDAIKESGFLGGVTQKATEVQETFSKAQNIAKAAIGGNVTALGFLRLALLATGLGAVVVVLGSLIAFLTKSQAGVDLVSRKFAGLKAVLGLVVGVAAEFGETLFKAFENPKQALSDLVDFIETNLLNRLKSLKIIFDGLTSGSINKVSEGLFQLSTGVTDLTGKLGKFTDQALAAAKAGEAIELESQRILRAERALNVERSESRARIEELKKLSDDSSKSVATRTEAAKEAARIENGLLAAQLKLQADRIQNTIVASKLDKQQTNDELDAIAELRAARADTQQESLTLQTELQNKINALGAEGAAKAEASRKAKDEAMLKSIEADIAAGLSREAAAAKYLAEEDRARAQAAQREEKARTDKLAADAAAYTRDLALLERNLEARRLLLESDKASGVVSQGQYEARLAVIDKGGFAARLLLAKHHNQDVNAAEVALTRFHNTENQKRTDAEKKAYQGREAAAAAFGQQVGALLSQTLLDTGKSLQDFAAGVLIIILDSLEKAALAAQAEAVIKNAPKGVAGLIEAGLEAAAITAAFETAKALIAGSGQSKPFATGGLVTGPGTGTSDSIPARLSNGESVMNANTTAMFAPLLSHLNVLGGGVAFATGGLVPSGPARPVPVADGGFLARQLGGVVPLIDYDALARSMSRVNLEVGVTPFRKAAARYDKARALSTLGS